jgi:TRAP-type C4-dicarboxylate transport system permease large subunit
MPRKSLFAAAALFGCVSLGAAAHSAPENPPLQTAPIILPPLKTEGFDLIWFGVVMSVIMEMGLIHPPVGLNIFVINKIAPDIRLGDIIWGTPPSLFDHVFCSAPLHVPRDLYLVARSLYG